MCCVKLRHKFVVSRSTRANKISSRFVLKNENKAFANNNSYYTCNCGSHRALYAYNVIYCSKTTYTYSNVRGSDGFGNEPV